METMTELIQRASELGVPNPSLFMLLPPKRRVPEIKKAISKAEKAARSKDE